MLMSPDDIGDFMTWTGSVLTAYHAAYQLYKSTSYALSQMNEQKDEYFGEAVWILQHLHELDESQRLAVSRAMADWENGLSLSLEASLDSDRCL